MNHIKIIILCLSMASFANAQFLAVGPFATSDQAILNQEALQSGSSFYVHHGSATVMDAGLFRGDGSGLTNISTSAFADVWVNESGDIMTGQLTIDGSTLTVGGPEFSVGGSSFIVLNGNVGISSATPGELFAVGDSLLTVKDCGSVHIGLISTCAFMLNVGTETFTGSRGKADSPPRLAFDNVFDNTGIPSINKLLFYNLNNTWVGGFGMSTNDLDWFVGPNGNYRFHTGTKNIDGTDASEIFSILANGNVGIGTTNPTDKLHVIGSATFTGAVTASTFNVTGSEYQVNGEKVIDGQRNIYAASLRISTVADPTSKDPDGWGELYTKADQNHPLWISTGTEIGDVATFELHRTNDSEGSGEMYISSGNVTVTVVSVSSTMYPVAGTVTAGYDNHNFSVVTSSLVYTGISTHTFVCIGDLNGHVVNEKDVSYAMTFSKNGVVTTASYEKTTISKENFNEHISTTKKISLTTGDTVNVNVCNVNTTANILVNSMIVNCFQVD